MQSITCIIPSTCSKRILPHLNKCLESLHEAAEVGGVSIGVIIVTERKDVNKKTLKYKVDKLLHVGKGTGFSQMNNLAIEKSLDLYPSDYQLLINDDAWVDGAFFKEFTKVVKNQNPDMIVPLIFEGETKTIDSFGIEYFTSGYAKNAPSFDIKTTLAPAACLLAKSSFLKKMKKIFGFYFNPLLFSYLEDVEFSIRAVAQAAKIKKVQKIKAYHIGSLSYGKKSPLVMYQTYRNILWIIIMTWPFKYIARNILSIIVVQGWVIFYSLIRFGPGLYIRVIMDTIRNFPKLMPNRKKILLTYRKDFDFGSIFSEYAFRTYHGTTIKV